MLLFFQVPSRNINSSLNIKKACKKLKSVKEKRKRKEKDKRVKWSDNSATCKYHTWCGRGCNDGSRGRCWCISWIWKYECNSMLLSVDFAHFCLKIKCYLPKMSEIASKIPAWPATPPKATTLTANAKRTGRGIPKSCRSISFARGCPLNRFNSIIKRKSWK